MNKTSIEKEKIGRAFGGHGKKKKGETGSKKGTVDMGGV